MSPQTLEATLFRRDVCELGEGPFWHDGQIWWVDIERGTLFSADRTGNLMERIHFGKRVGSVVPAPDGKFLVAREKEIERLDLASKCWDAIAWPKDVLDDSRFNDGKCDPRGRFVVGTMSPDGCRKDSSLYSLHGDLSLHRLRGEISISNGLAWSSDGETLYFVDTPDRCIFAYDYDLETGAIARERVVLQFQESDGYPDGMTIDREGRLWIGFWDGWAVRCYRPETGTCERIVKVPCARATSCCFGGESLSQLFITTARVGLKPDELARQPLAGSLFVCETETTGFPTTLFNYEHHQKS
jgi:sugar lactone lactonase YvrE